MNYEYYYEDDVDRILDLDDMYGYIFKFVHGSSRVVRMRDQNYDGEFDETRGRSDEVCFLFSAGESPEWPVVLEY